MGRRHMTLRPLVISGWGDTLAVDDIHNAYEQVKDMINVQAFQAIVCAIIIFAVIMNIYHQYDEIAHSEAGTPNGAHFFQLFGKQITVILVVAFLPVGLSLIEGIFCKAMDQLINGLTGGTGTYDIDDMFLKPCEKAYSETEIGTLDEIKDFVSTVTSPLKALDDVLARLAGMICAPIYMYMHILFLAARYMFLLLLELVSPIAIACLTMPDLKQHFYTWLRGMFCCYMLLPGFLMATLFSDAIVCVFARDSATPVTVLVVFSLLLKMMLLNTVKKNLPQII